MIERARRFTFLLPPSPFFIYTFRVCIKKFFVSLIIFVLRFCHMWHLSALYCETSRHAKSILQHTLQNIYVCSPRAINARTVTLNFSSGNFEFPPSSPPLSNLLDSHACDFKYSRLYVCMLFQKSSPNPRTENIIEPLKLKRHRERDHKPRARARARCLLRALMLADFRVPHKRFQSGPRRSLYTGRPLSTGKLAESYEN